MGDAGGLTYVGKGAVAIVVIELRAAEAIAQKEVGTAVVIVVAPGAGNGGPDGFEARLIGDFRKGAIAIIVKQAVGRFAFKETAQIVGDEQVEIAIAIVISPGRGKGRAPDFQTSLCCDVGEGAIPVVAE